MIPHKLLVTRLLICQKYDVAPSRAKHGKGASREVEPTPPKKPRPSPFLLRSHTKLQNLEI